MRSRRKMLCLVSICAVLGLTGCTFSDDTSASEQTVAADKLEPLGEIQVITREEGSGTRSTFAELADFQENEEGKEDLTREDAQVANNAEEVIKEVAENQASIGYVSLGALGDSKEVKALRVNGALAELDNKKYPLSRTFYLAYSGKLNELERDFLTYIHGAGQKIVEKSFVPVAKSSSFLSNQEKGSIVIGGSTSVAPLMQELAEEYRKINPNADIRIEQSDSTDGLTKAMEGTYDFAMSSRDMKVYEKELLNYEAVAEDKIAVIVNAENPLEDISLEMLKDIYTGGVKEWKELGK